MQITRLEAQALFAAGRGGEALARLLDEIDGDPDHPGRAELEAWVRQTAATASQSYRDLVLPHGAGPRGVLQLAGRVAVLGSHGTALSLLALARRERDPYFAYYRAKWAMRAGRYKVAVAACDVALETLTGRRQAFDPFVEGCLTARPAEPPLQFRPREVLATPRLREPLLWRWEALKRLGDRQRAGRMRDLCMRLFRNQVSVWVTAGNHALDEDDLDSATRYFRGALARDPDSVPALSGCAIVAEHRKNWPAALELRTAAANRGQAWTRNDPASLHRVIRHGAALGRLERWDEAGPQLRASVRRGAYTVLPAERPVLLKVFSGPLFSPLMIATMLGGKGSLGAASGDPAVQLALLDAQVLADITRRVKTASLEPCERRLLLGMCAWEAGDPEAAYVHMDEVDAMREGDIEANYLLLVAAIATHANQRTTIERFACDLARARLSDDNANPYERLFATLTLQRAEAPYPRAALHAHPLLGQARAAQAQARAASGSVPITLPSPPDRSWIGRLRWGVAVKESYRVAGVPTTDLALACARARVTWARAQATT